MSPSQSNGNNGLSPISAKIPTSHAEALYQIKNNRDTRSNPVNFSDIIREAVREYLALEDLPENARQVLDEEELAEYRNDVAQDLAERGLSKESKQTLREVLEDE